MSSSPGCPMTDPASFTLLTAAEIGRKIAAGKLDPVTVAEAFLERIAACDDQTIFLKVTAERALREARAARRRQKRGERLGPLDGVPIAWKDLADMKGEVTTMGSLIYARGAAATSDAATVRNVAAAGMVALGKTNMPEFAFSGLGANPGFGTPRNPYDDKVHRVPGGSSTGSAVAVARALAPVATGSDTSGSVRIPSAWCGITGYMSTRKRMDMSGVWPLSARLDTLGVLARCVEDCVLVEQAMRGVKQRALSVHSPKAHALKGVRILVPENDVFDGVADAVAANFEAAMIQLAKAGAKIRRGRIAAFDQFRALVQAHGHLAGAEGYYLHRKELEGPDAALADPFIGQRILAAGKMSAFDLLTILNERKRLSALFLAEIDGFDLVAYPTMLDTAPELEEIMRDHESFMAHAGRSIRNTMLGNFLSLCGLAMPSGFDAEGLPTSLLLSARGNDDARLLAIGRTAEAVLGGAG